MSFYGSAFSFDGVSCEDYGLIMYDFNNTNNGASEFAKGYAVEEDRIPRRHKSIYYGAYYKNTLEFNLVFGVGQRAADRREYIDRQLMEVVAMWLTGKDGYKKLTIDQPDMREYYYNCIIKDLKTIEYSGDKWAFSCHVVCDSPYAYLHQKEYTFTSTNVAPTTGILHSRSSVNDPYLPNLVITRAPGASTDLSISISGFGDTATARETRFTGLSDKDSEIKINGETGVVTSHSGVNVYNNFNFVFPRLYPGDNQITITGDATVRFVCDFPVNIGG